LKLNSSAIARLRAASLSAAGIANIFERLVESLADYPEMLQVASMSLDYQAPTDEVAEGDLIPVITISLRPATIITEARDVGTSVDVHPGSTGDE
jgi:hypothetical protein